MVVASSNVNKIIFIPSHWGLGMNRGGDRECCGVEEYKFNIVHAGKQGLPSCPHNEGKLQPHSAKASTRH